MERFTVRSKLRGRVITLTLLSIINPSFTSGGAPQHSAGSAIPAGITTGLKPQDVIFNDQVSSDSPVPVPGDVIVDQVKGDIKEYSSPGQVISKVQKVRTEIHEYAHLPTYPMTQRIVHPGQGTKVL